jgi:lipid A 3-O-deacylase
MPAARYVPTGQRPIGVSRRARSIGLVAGCVLASLAGVASAQSAFSPSGMFVQLGTAGSTHGFTSGLTWDWSRQWDLVGGKLGGYWELSLSRWSYPTMDGRSEAWLGQVGIVPTFRYRAAEGTSPWFVELGIGASLTTAVYETQRKRFSTSFNFADRIGVGRNFGASGQHELSLRVEHFSNAGIKRPNPGENFAQLRYSYRFR